MGRPVLSKVSSPNVGYDVSGILRERCMQTDSRQRIFGGGVIDQLLRDAKGFVIWVVG